MNIDFVVTWVDEKDEKWQSRKNYYSGESSKILNDESRYRDWNNFQFWFRSVEKYAPWVHKVFLITEGHIPSWINKNNKKLVCIRHSDYIDQKFLPTFNSNVIELNLVNLKTLSEHFVLFNDDMFINKPVTPNDFFSKQGVPKDTGIFSPLIPQRNSMDHTVLNDIDIIASHFRTHEVLKTSFFKFFNWKYSLQIVKNLTVLPWNKILGFYDTHLPVSYKKSTFQTVWSLEKDVLTENNQHKFRSNSDVSHWIMRYWQLCSKNGFTTRKISFGKYYEIATNIQQIVRDLREKNHALICLNDSATIFPKDFSMYRSILNKSLEAKFPERSSFEIEG